MSGATRSEFTGLLMALREKPAGDRDAAERVFEIAYEELRQLAAGLMRRERADHTLQPTEPVHEVYGRLVDTARVRPESRAHFFGIASRAMRQFLIQYARRRHAEKRGGDWQCVSVSNAGDLARGPDIDVLELDELLERLAQLDERMARVVELRVFGGLTAEEAAQTLGISRQTVQDDWRVARMWLRREMSASGP